MRKSERFPAVTFEHGEFCVRIDFDPQKDMRANGVYIWRPGRTGHDIDDKLDEISRKASRAIQRRAAS